MVVAAVAGGVALLVGGIRVSATTTLAVNSAIDADAALNSDTACPAVCTLRAAIHVANNVGGAVQINVPAGTYSLSLGDLKVGTYNAAQAGYAITLQGAGAATTTIQQGDGSSRVFNLDPTLHGNVDVTIDGVTVTGGHDSATTFGGGAGIISGFQGDAGLGRAADNTTLSNCIVTNNHVTSNSATNRPGGGVQNEGGNLTITNCTISNNSSGSSEGGGVYYDSHSPSTGTLTVSGSTFSGNTLANTSGVFVGGAGLKVLGPTATAYLISNSVFSNNIATGSSTGPVGGGAIDSNQGDLQVTRSTFTGNQANGPSAVNAGGGAINASSGGDAAASFFVRLNRIVGNSASNGPGGVYAGVALDFANDWWGCNAGPGNAGCDGASGATTNPRLTLVATASPSTIRVTQTSTVTATLKINSASADTSVSLGATLHDGIAVGFANGTFGTVSPNSSTLTSASTSTTYTAGATGGAESVPVTVDNQTVDAPITVQQPPTITSADNTTFLAGSAGSFQVTASGYPAPTFSESGSLPSGVTLNSAGLLSGTPNTGTGNVYPVSITATNAVTPNDIQNPFTLTVNEAPFITSANTKTFTVGTPGTYTITSRGYPAPSITLTSGSLPSGVTYDLPTHVLSGTPATGTGGQYSLQFTSHNGIGSDSVQPLTLTVDEAASITSADTTTFTVGTPGSFTVQTGGYPRPQLSDGGATLPTGVTFVDNTDGTATLSGTPATGQGATYPMTITAHNNIGTDATKSLTLTVDEAATVTSADHTTFTTGSPGSFSVTTHGFPRPTLSDGGATLPTGVSFTDNGDGSATLSGTPATATGATYPFTITVHNSIGADGTQSFTLTVDQAPAITSADHATFQVGTPGSFSLTTTGFPQVTALSDGGASLPPGVSFTDNGNGTATIAGTPGGASASTYPMTLGATNGVSPDASQSFTLTVQGAPHFSSADHTTFVVGQPGTFSVTTTGSTPMTVGESGSLPGGVTYTDNGDGTATLTGTPNAATAGSYPLTLTAHNSQPPNAVQSFTLTVNQVAAITSAGTTSFTVGTPGSFTVTATGTPTPGVSDGGATLPAGVTFVDNNNGTATLSGTPGAGTGATYPMTITAHNGVGSDATQPFTLTVNEAPAITSAGSTTFPQGAVGSFGVSTQGYPKPALTQTGATLPSGVTFADNGNGTGTLNGTPATGTGGVYHLSLKAHNGIGSDATQAFTLTVTEGKAITSASGTTFTAGTAGSFGVTTRGFPTPTLSDGGATLPAGVSFVDNGDGSATLGGTPGAATGAAYPFTITAHNSQAPDVTQSFILTVNEAAAITSANHASFLVSSLGSFTVTTRGFPIPGLTESGSLPTGVTFTDNGNGTATLGGTPAAGTSGTYPLSLKAHNGTGSDGTQAFTLQVGAAQTKTTVVSTTATPTFGSPDTFTATVAPLPPAAGTPGGAVTFAVDGTTTAAVTLVSGQAQWTTSTLQQGGHTITAAYGGQANTFQPSNGATNVTVGCAVTYTTRISKTLTISSGSACINGAHIEGGVHVSGGASVSIVNATIADGIRSDGARLLTVCHSSIDDSLSVTSSTGFVLIGSNGDDRAMPCAGNNVTEGVTLTRNSGGVELGGNSIRGSVVVSNNVLAVGAVDAENGAPEIEHNTIRGSLTCDGNSPAPSDDGAPNRVSDARRGQCRRSGF
jgi:hypothetical protein